MRAAIWGHVLAMLLLAVLGAVVFSFPVVFLLVYPIVVPRIEGLGVPSWLAMLVGLALSVAALVAGAIPASLYFKRSTISCAEVGCPGRAQLFATSPVTYRCPTCGSLQKAWFGLRGR